MTDKLHPLIGRAGAEMADGRLDRREFLRIATLLGVAAPAAYGLAGLSSPVMAQAAAPKKGGIIRLGTRVQDLKSPHTYSWIEAANATRQTLDYLTFTGIDNVTRPNLIEKWDASPDLKTWTFTLRKDIVWRKGRKFTADDVPCGTSTACSTPRPARPTVGLLKGFILDRIRDRREGRQDPDEKEVHASCGMPVPSQKVDDFTIKLVGQDPQSRPSRKRCSTIRLMMMRSGGGRRVQSRLQRHRRVRTGRTGGQQARGAGQLTRNRIGAAAPTSTAIEVIDIGEDPATQVAALAGLQAGRHDLSGHHRQRFRRWRSCRTSR